MAITALEKELVKATKVKMRGDRQEALKALVVAVNGLPDESWRGLSPDAQAWYNAASEAVDNEQEVEDFDAPAESAESAESEEEAPAEAEDGGEEGSEESSDESTEAEPPPTRGKSKQKEPKMPAKKAQHAKGKANGKEKPAPAKAAKAPAKASTKKPAAKPAARPAVRSSEGGEGGPTIIRRAVIKNPKITAGELTEILAKKNRKISPTTVSSVRAASVSMLKLLDEAGNLKNLKL